MELDDDEKKVWRLWASWDKKRYARDLALYEAKNSHKPAKESKDLMPKTKNGDKDDSLHVPKKRKSVDGAHSETSFDHIPKKKKSRG